MRKTVAMILLLVCMALPALAGAVSGQSIAVFEANYEEDIDFINANDNRHLLPLVLSSRKSDLGDGKMYYELLGDVLSVTIRTDATGEIIETCTIILTAPSGMEYGNSIYNDFAISGYHSYALLMAMDSHAKPADRYQLVRDVVDGLADDGDYTAQLGVYTLHCVRVDNAATLMFENSMVQPTPEPTAEGDAPVETVPPEDDNGGDEGAGMG